MTDVAPGFEIEDLEGQTLQYAQSVSTSATPFPLVADKVISSFQLAVPVNGVPNSNVVQFSIDGINFATLRRGSVRSLQTKKNVTQLFIKANASTPIELIINFEP